MAEHTQSFIFWTRGAKQTITKDDLAGYQNTSFWAWAHRTGATLTNTKQQFLKIVLKGKVAGILMFKKFNKPENTKDI